MSKIPSPPIKLSVVTLALALLLWTNLGILPILDQSIVASKYTTVLLFGLIMLAWYFISSFKKGTLSFIKTPFTFPITLFALITLISLVANNRYPVEGLLGLGGIFLSISLLVLTGGLLVKSQTNNTQKLLGALGISTVVLLATTVLQQFGVGPSQLLNKAFNLNLPNNALFNLSGSNLVALQITLLTAVGFATRVMQNKKAKIWESGVLVASAVAIIFYGWLLLPGKITTPVILSPTASWSITVSALRNLKTTLLGVGPDNYLQAYNLYKPVWINNSAFWNVQFSQGFNQPLSLIVTLGVFGLIVWLLLVLNTLKQTKSVSNQTKPIQMMLLVSFGLQFFMPINIVLLTVQAILMVFWIANEKERFATYSLNLKGLLAKNKLLASKSNLFVRLIIGLLTIGSIMLLVGLGLATYSSHLMFRSAKAATQNDFVSAYALQQQAIKLNPYLDISRRKYAVTNIVIAAAISQKADLTEDDKQRFAVLIQQAIREGKAAVILDPNDTANWQLAGQIYQTLIGVAENSEEWSVNAYAEAIKLSPNNPELRLILGGVLLGTKQYEEALQFFEQAVLLKPNYVNAYYNGANTLKLLKKFDEAKLAYQKTLMLLQPDSDDYLKTANELQVLEQLVKEAVEKQAETSGSLPTVNPIGEEIDVEAPPTTSTTSQNQSTSSGSVKTQP